MTLQTVCIYDFNLLIELRSVTTSLSYGLNFFYFNNLADISCIVFLFVLRFIEKGQVLDIFLLVS